MEEVFALTWKGTGSGWGRVHLGGDTWLDLKEERGWDGKAFLGEVKR